MKKRCLLVLSRLPYPPVGDDRLKSYHNLNMVDSISINYQRSIGKASSLLWELFINLKFQDYVVTSGSMLRGSIEQP